MARLLLAVVGDVLYLRPPPIARTEAALQLRIAVQAQALARLGNCSFDASDLQAPGSHVEVHRLATGSLPASLSVGPGPAPNATLALPPTLAAVLADAVGGSVDLIVAVAPAAASWPTPIVSVAFTDPVSGEEVAISGLADPITIAFAAPGRPRTGTSART